MLILPPYTKGIDYNIQLLATNMYNYLKRRWTITDDTKYNCFGRAYRNNTKDGYIPEFYNNGKYVSSNNSNNAGGLFYDDRLAAMSFFGLLDPIRRDHSQTYAADIVRMELLFFVNLNLITAGGIVDPQGQRLDEECINDVRNFIQRGGNNFEVIEAYRDIDKVLERYSGAAKRDALINNMHPKFCFKIILEVRYNPLLNT